MWLQAIVDVINLLWIGEDFLVHSFVCGVRWWTSCLILASDLIVSLFWDGYCGGGVVFISVVLIPTF